MFTSNNGRDDHREKTAKIDCKVEQREEMQSVFLLQIATRA